MTLSDARIINNLGEMSPDYCGMVFAHTSHHLSDIDAMHIRDSLSGSIQAVGVFVNEPTHHIVELVQNDIIQLVQLHGDEDELYIKQLRLQIDCPIIKAVRLKDRDDMKRADELDVDFLLSDAFVKGLLGGTGQMADTSLIPSDLKHPLFMAGGLCGENVAKIIDNFHPYAVDASSRLETDGKKDEGKIRAFMEAVCNAGIQSKQHSNT